MDFISKRVGKFLFGSLKSGEVFEYNGNYYIKAYLVDVVDFQTNATGFHGGHTCFDDDDEVRLIEGAFVEGYGK